MSYSLIIVESPAKCKKIESFLGSKFKCKASIGHFRLLNSLDQIDMEKMTAKYLVSPDKKKNLSDLKKCISDASEVILATDNDREGEAIGWHICDYFKLPITKTKRILFQEITKPAIIEALNNPTLLNMNLVKAQQTRQILDLLVGYKISPTLWKSISAQYEKHLSAGRCQTPALRIIYENELENEKKACQVSHSIKGWFTSKNIQFQLDKTWSQDEEGNLQEFYKSSIEYTFTISIGKSKLLVQNPPLPFDTSTLQQASSNELHYSPKNTMKYAQELYENGYITYMRTDQKKFSQEFLLEISKHITSTYGDEYLSKNLENIKLVVDKKDEAHEAIRPISVLVDKIDGELTAQAKKLYQLIRNRTLESCMDKSKINYIVCEIPTKEGYTFKNRSEKFSFMGWRIVKSKDDSLSIENYNYLSSLKNGSEVVLNKLLSEITMKDGQHHITEAQLVSLLEKKGIGRPSTFSSLVDKIQEREYVKKEDILGKEVEINQFTLENKKIKKVVVKKKLGGEKNKLIITPVGRKVIEFLVSNFDDLFYYDFTKKMEDDLDKISKGNLDSKNMCLEINDNLQNKLQNSKFSKEEDKLDDNHKIIMGKYGPVIKKTIGDKVSFINIPKEINVEDLKSGKIQISDLDALNKKDFVLSENGQSISIKYGKYGYYAVKGQEKISLKDWTEENINAITFADIIKQKEEKKEGGNYNKFITNDLSIRKSKYGYYLYCKTKAMNKPAFYKVDTFQGDISVAEVEEVKQWIRETYSNLKL